MGFFMEPAINLQSWISLQKFPFLQNPVIPWFKNNFDQSCLPNARLRLQKELEDQRETEESKLRKEHEASLSNLDKETQAKIAEEKRQLQSKYDNELEEFRLRVKDEHDREMADIKKNNEVK